MNSYKPGVSVNIIGGIAAVVATIATLGIAVMVPVQVSSSVQSRAGSPASTQAPQVDVAAARYRIEVIGSRKNAA
ncbi:MAG: hypothetical protein M3Z31_15495 [Pseudomonadota bacterium]|nr:hypothetical protein [Pseudomonadota bacterium]